jgi:hypothetical protein
MKRRPGDIYQIKVESGIALFQHCCDDASQLGSHVVAVSATIWPSTTLPTALLGEFESSEISFFVHVFLKAGETLKVWERIGNGTLRSFDLPLWGTPDTLDYSVPTATSWWVWSTNGEAVRTSAPRVIAETEYGDTMPPAQVIERIIRGRYSAKIPGKPQVR